MPPQPASTRSAPPRPTSRPGPTFDLGCLIVNAVHPVPPSVPTAVQAVGGFGSATVTWHAPASDGGAPWTSYTVTAMPGAITQTVGPTATSAIITGLKPGPVTSSPSWHETSRARSVGGASPAIAHPGQPAAADGTGPGLDEPLHPQHHRRRSRPRQDARRGHRRRPGQSVRPRLPGAAGHRWPGPGRRRRGAQRQRPVRQLRATSSANVEAYVAGYASAQKASAPVVIAVGTNNDMDVSSTTGAAWAQLGREPDPGLRRTVLRRSRSPVPTTSSRASGPGTRRPRRGCRATWPAPPRRSCSTARPTVARGRQPACGCNNGWSMAGLYYLAGGARLDAGSSTCRRSTTPRWPRSGSTSRSPASRRASRGSTSAARSPNGPRARRAAAAEA